MNMGVMSYSLEILDRKERISNSGTLLTVKKARLSAKPLTAISLFSGGGGLDLGFAAAGFAVGCSSDIDPFSCSTLRLNRGKKSFYSHGNAIVGDIRKITGADLLREADLEKGAVDIVLGGPPCQAFSVLGGGRGWGTRAEIWFGNICE